MTSRAASSDDRTRSTGLDRMRAVLDAVDTPSSAASIRAELASVASPHVVAFVNAHAMNMAADKADFALSLTRADTLLRDGSGMKTLSRLLGRDPGPNLNGTDLIPDLIDEATARGEAIALFGTAEPWLGQARDAIKARGGDVSVVLDGFQDSAAYRETAAACDARLIILAMGMPKQEAIAIDLKASMDRPCLIVCGGAILDFLARRHPRAPGWVRDLGMEWAYRLGREPVRLFRRYVFGNAAFLWRAARLKSGAGRA